MSLELASCLIAASVLALAGGACAREAASTVSFDSTAVSDTVAKLEAHMNEAVDALDCETGLTALGARTPAFVSSGFVVRTASELRKMCADMVANRRSAHFAIDSLSAHALSPDAAYVVREGKYTIQPLNDTAVTIYMVMTTVWHRQADGWKMVHLHESVVPPAR